MLFLFLKNKNLFEFNQVFLVRFFKIVFASITMGLFFKYLIDLFKNQLVYSYDFKFFYLIICVLLGCLFYFMVTFFIKAFNSKDLKLKY